jgi:hypothetical protein
VIRLPEPVWRARRETDLARVAPLAADRVKRSGQKHPVYDFLFEYYNYRPAYLLRWTPGVDVVLEGATLADSDWPNLFQTCAGGIELSTRAFPDSRRSYLRWAMQYLHNTQQREPVFGCFGRHEWAMVYQSQEIRHGRVPLRLSQQQTNEVVETSAVRCTHYDAFRFFTPTAQPRNQFALTRDSMDTHDQPGCVHVNMDLYKFAYKIAPFVSSDITADAFELAVQARILDMRASPYDLREFGFTPICIETKEGREEYAVGQRAVWLRGQPVRERLLSAYQQIAQPAGSTRPIEC